METKMQAVVLTKDFKMEQVPTKEIPKPTATQVRVQLRACALNRRDYWITQKLYPKVKVWSEGGRSVNLPQDALFPQRPQQIHISFLQDHEISPFCFNILPSV